MSAGNTQSDPTYTDGHKIILLQLTSDKTMKAEYQSGIVPDKTASASQSRTTDKCATPNERYTGNMLTIKRVYDVSAASDNKCNPALVLQEFLSEA